MLTEESFAVKIEKEKGEQLRVFLQKNELIRPDLRIKKDEHFLYIPIIYKSKFVSNFNVITERFERTKPRINNYQQLLSLPVEFQHILPTSFDVIGDIILIKIPKDLQKYSKEIGNALLTTHAHVNTVCSMDPVSGEFRNRSVRVIAGEQKTETIHKEYGIWFKIDVEKTYFSPRLANERRRVSAIIKNNSCVFDMFCGVAPFSILIAKYAQPSQIVAVDINPFAIQLAEYNVRINNVEDKITLFNKDSRESQKLCIYQNIQPNHIIMNLPFSAFEFFPIAVQLIINGGMIHYYDILNESQFEQRVNDLIIVAKKYQANLTHLDLHKIKTYAPHEFYIGIDITVSKN